MKDIKSARSLTIMDSKVVPNSTNIYVDISGRKQSGTRFRFQGEIPITLFIQIKRDLRLKSLVK